LRLLFDTNVVINFLKQQESPLDLPALMLQHECFVSVIVKLELLKSADISAAEEQNIYDFLQLVPVMPFNEAIEKETIALSRATKLKLPDTIIGATAIAYNAEVVTSDPHFIKCRHEKLRIWKNPAAGSVLEQ